MYSIHVSRLVCLNGDKIRALYFPQNVIHLSMAWTRTRKFGAKPMLPQTILSI